MMLKLSKFVLLLAIILAVGCSSPAKNEARIALGGKPVDEVIADPSLQAIAVRRGKEIFEYESCWNCHGKDLKGDFLFCPDLTDKEWLWGAEPKDIFQTIKFGVRQMKGRDRPAENTRWLVMPQFKNQLDIRSLNEVAAYTKKLINGDASSDLGAQVFAQNCTVCHGPLGKGGVQIGVPALAAQPRMAKYSTEKLVKLIGSELYAQTKGPGSVASISRGMPAWGTDPIVGYSDEDIKSLVAYIISKGSGK